MDIFSNKVYYSLFMGSQRLVIYSQSFINMGRHNNLSFEFVHKSIIIVIAIDAT